MTKKGLRDKYTPLIEEISKIMGVEKPTKVLRLCAVIDSYLGKPTDILKLCEAVDSFFRPLEKQIVELEQKNKRLTRELSHEQAAYDQMFWKKNEIIVRAKDLLAKWVELFRPKNKDTLPTPIQIETEQFLKENAND